MNDNKCCKTCLFSTSKIDIKERLLCRFNPPVPIPTQQINPISQQPELSMIAILTPVQNDGWCGQYKPKLAS